jgi:GcrA cell cycle regulator
MPTKDSFPWPHEAVAMLRKYWAEGASASYIAGRINAAYGEGIDRNSVIGKVHRLGLKRDADAELSGRQRAGEKSWRNRKRGPRKKKTRHVWTPRDIRPVPTPAQQPSLAPVPSLDKPMPAPPTQAVGTTSWTPEREAALTKLWNAGLTGDQIAARLGGVSRNAAIAKARRLGLERSPATSEYNRSVNGKKAAAANRAKSAFPVRDPVPPAPLPITPPIAPDAKPITLWDISSNTCCWPVTDDSPFLFCGDPRDPRSGKHDRGYCTEHWLRSISSERRGRKRADVCVGVE